MAIKSSQSCPKKSVQPQLLSSCVCMLTCSLKHACSWLLGGAYAWSTGKKTIQNWNGYIKVQSSYHETTKPWLICPALHRPLPLVVLLHPSACLGLVPGWQSKVCPKWFASQWVPASCWFSSARRPSMGHVRMRLRGMHGSNLLGQGQAKRSSSIRRSTAYQAQNSWATRGDQRGRQPA